MSKHNFFLLYSAEETKIFFKKNKNSEVDFAEIHFKICGCGTREKVMVNAEKNKRRKARNLTPPTSKRETEYNGRVRAAGPLRARKAPLSTVFLNTLPFLTLPPPGFQDAVFFDSSTLQIWVLSLSPSWGSVLSTLLWFLPKALSLLWCCPPTNDSFFF